MRAVYLKELKSYFFSPIAYVLIGLFMILTSIFFIPNLTAYQYGGDFNSNLSTMGYFLIFIVPILTMRILAEERKNKVDVLLITTPVKLSSIVLGKYLASLTVFMVIVVITFIYPIILIAFGAKLTAQLVGGYIGFILLGASFMAVGVFASAITENQIIAAIISFAGLLVMWIADGIAGLVGGIIAKVLGWVSLLSRYEDFNQGVLGLSPIVYYISFIAVFLFATVMVIEKRRWSQG
jgi:ABC-2 type transport system permease protein